MSIDVKTLVKQVGRLRVVTSRLVDEQLSGEYHSVFKGRGIEFDEVREYVPGDDARAIDWNVTARFGHPFVKRFCEERELTIVFLVDASGSQTFGSGERSKAETAAELACLIALSAIKNQDKVGLAIFSDRIEKYLPPRKGRVAAMRLVREILASETTRRGTDLALALRFLNRVQKRRAVVFLVSDFMADGYADQLRVAARRHDVICCVVSDPVEQRLPGAGLVEVEDPETGHTLLLDAGSAAVRSAFEREAQTETETLQRLFRQSKTDALWLSTDRGCLRDLYALFRRRQKRTARGQ